MSFTFPSMMVHINADVPNDAAPSLAQARLSGLNSRAEVAAMVERDNHQVRQPQNHDTARSFVAIVQGRKGRIVR